MRRLFLSTLFVAAMVPASLKAQRVTEATALQKATSFLRSQAPKPPSGRHHSPSSAPLGLVLQTNAYYIFNADGGQGYVIVSSDERTDDILGYSTSGTIHPATMPAAMRSWLASYEEQVMALADDDTPATTLLPIRNPVDPMLATRWHQSDPYNRHCPVDDGQYCPTGCVATALAQLINYHCWPADSVAIGSLPACKFDWESMKAEYSSEECDSVADGVATLMRYCGESVNTRYGLRSSSASASTAALLALGYDSTAQRIERYEYSIAEWDSLIYRELAAGRPVWYSGYDMNGEGHCFVCDGYDGNGGYHINWGWGGNGDGFFKLSVLAPGGSVSGKGATARRYCSGQSAIVAIRPPTGEAIEPPTIVYPRLVMTDQREKTGDALAVTIYATYANHSSQPATIDMGLLALQDDSTATEHMLVLRQGTQVEAGATYIFDNKGVAFPLAAILRVPKGRYRLYAVWKDTEEEHWHRDSRHYVDIDTGSGGLRLTEHPTFCVKARVECQLQPRVNSPIQMAVAISNEGDETNELAYLYASPDTIPGRAIDMAMIALERSATDTLFFHHTFQQPGINHVWVTAGEMLLSSGVTLVDTTMAVLPPVVLSLKAARCSPGSDGPAELLNLTIANTDDTAFQGTITSLLYNEEQPDSVCAYLASDTLTIAPGDTTQIALSLCDIDPSLAYNVRFNVSDHANKLSYRYFDNLTLDDNWTLPPLPPTVADSAAVVFRWVAESIATDTIAQRRYLEIALEEPMLEGDEIHIVALLTTQPDSLTTGDIVVDCVFGKGAKISFTFTPPLVADTLLATDSLAMPRRQEMDCVKVVPAEASGDTSFCLSASTLAERLQIAEIVVKRWPPPMPANNDTYDQATLADVNRDGQVDVGDVMAIINDMATGMATRPGSDSGDNASTTGDVNGDGEVDIGDVMAVINIMAL